MMIKTQENPEVDKIKLFYVTWNLQGQAAKENELSLILPKKEFFHIYAIGTEECMRSILASFFYANKSGFEEMLHNYFGDEYFAVKSENLDAIHLIVLAHNSIKHNISKISSGVIKNGVGNMVGNKGAVAIAFNYNFTSIIFINCHLAGIQSLHLAGHHKSDKRNLDFERINKELKLNNIDLNENKSVTDQFDIAIWSGDFNYRIDTDKTYINLCLDDQSDILVDSLIYYDQMTNEINTGNLKINKFTESRIKFFPTYKFDVGTDNYFVGEQFPGWTDRIIYKSTVKNFLQNKDYNWIKEVKSSDHKPVYAIFDLSIPRNSPINQSSKENKLTGSKACLII